jgi:hypothetical protein
MSGTANPGLGNLDLEIWTSKFELQDFTNSRASGFRDQQACVFINEGNKIRKLLLLPANITARVQLDNRYVDTFECVAHRPQVIRPLYLPNFDTVFKPLKRLPQLQAAN